MKTEIDGKVVKILGSFKVEDIDKEYVICCYDEDASSDKVLIIIQELQEIDGEKKLVPIKEEEKEIVLATYEAVKETLLGGEE